MPLDLSYFLLALKRAPSRGSGFDPDELAWVESAWNSSEAAARMFGWVVVLRGGQRLYLEMEVTGVERQSADLEITPLLAAQQEYPDELDAVPWYWPCHINQHLGLAGALH